MLRFLRPRAALRFAQDDVKSKQIRSASSRQVPRAGHSLVLLVVSPTAALQPTGSQVRSFGADILVFSIQA